MGCKGGLQGWFDREWNSRIRSIHKKGVDIMMRQADYITVVETATTVVVTLHQGEIGHCQRPRIDRRTHYPTHLL